MSETWLSFCVRRPGPPSKQGYSGVPSRTLAEIEGEVDHSMEGTLAGALGELDKLERRASWTFSIPKIGPPLQHYPLEAVTWHCGVAGDRSVDTSLIGNLTLLGKEHEDYPDNELNANQLKWTVAISQETRRLCPRVASRPPLLRVNLFEHGWLSATSCPSGLIPWAAIIAALEEDDMDEVTVKRLIAEALLPYATKASVTAARKAVSDHVAAHNAAYEGSPWDRLDDIVRALSRSERGLQALSRIMSEEEP